MEESDGEILRDDLRRECVRVTTPSGVNAVVDTSISTAELASMARSLECKLRRSVHLLVAPGKSRPAGLESQNQDPAVHDAHPNCRYPVW